MMGKEPHPNSTDGHHYDCQMAHWVWQRRQVIKQTKAEMTVLNTARECDGVGIEVKTDNSRKQLLSTWQLVPGPSVFPSFWMSQTWQVEITCLHRWCTWFLVGWRISHWVMSVTASERSTGQWESVDFIGAEVSSLQWVSFTDKSVCHSRFINKLKHWRSYGRYRYQFLT